MTTTTVPSAFTRGTTGQLATIECELVRRLPSMVIVGMPAGQVRETAERVRSAIVEADLEFPRKRVVVNAAPTDMVKRTTGLDLPIAVAVLAASGQMDVPESTAFIGELSLDGNVHPVRGIIAMVKALAEAGIKRVVVPFSNRHEAALVDGIEVRAVLDLEDVVEGRDAPTLPPAAPAPTHDLDLSEVRGQHRAKRALEIAVAGGLSVLFIGNPGAGKTMLAARTPSILPPMTRDEALEVATIHDATGLHATGSGLPTRRPFRAPHHAVSAAGMVGSAAFRPGEVTLAHNGVLFLDDVTEFSRSVIECMRRAHQDKAVTTTRASGSTTMPADFMLVGACNPCPCGYLGSATRQCTCPSVVVERYQQRIPRDLFDVVVWLHTPTPEDVLEAPKGEPSADVQARVVAARERGTLAATLEGDELVEQARPSDEARACLARIMGAYGLSGRAHGRILRRGYAIARLDGAAHVEGQHLLEAAAFRSVIV